MRSRAINVLLDFFAHGWWWLPERGDLSLARILDELATTAH